MAYTDGRYSDVQDVLAKLRYVGISQVRDTISDGSNGSADLKVYLDMARQGIKWTYLSSTGGAQSEATLKRKLSLIEEVIRAVPGSVLSVEGSNEINNAPVTWEGRHVASGADELAAALAMQRSLFSYVHGSEAFRGVKVAMFTGAGDGDVPSRRDPADLTGLADLATQHPYPKNGEPPFRWVDPHTALPGETGPYIYTEAGYSSKGGTLGAVDLHLQASYLLDLICDTALFQVKQTSLYQLLDAYAPDSPQGDDGTGLFDYQGAAKPSAVALHRLTTILADATIPRTNVTEDLKVELKQMPATSHSLQLSRSDGAIDLLLWAEPRLWSLVQGRAAVPPRSEVTIDLPEPRHLLSVFDPMVDIQAIHQTQNASTVTVVLSDHPIIVRISERRA